MRKPSKITRTPKNKKIVRRKQTLAPIDPKPLAFGNHYTDAQMADMRGKTRRTQARERLTGKGPPFVRDGRNVWYPIAGWLAYLAAHEQQPVREKARAHAAAP